MVGKVVKKQLRCICSPKKEKIDVSRSNMLKLAVKG